MGLKEGTLESLIESGDSDPTSVADLLFPQMLEALDCLAYNSIIHRDVKPENILYVSQPGGRYRFQLGDFGLCNRVVDAKTLAGSHTYMAPEIFRTGGQTSMLDVWSLFVTMLWTLNVGGFRQRSNRGPLRMFTEQFYMRPQISILFQRSRKWQPSTQRSVLLRHRCLSSITMELG